MAKKVKEAQDPMEVLASEKSKMVFETYQRHKLSGIVKNGIEAVQRAVTHRDKQHIERVIADVDVSVGDGPVFDDVKQRWEAVKQYGAAAL